MSTYKRISLYTAIAGVGAMGMIGTAQAVNVSPDGRGDVLIFPYYTTRADGAGNAFSTLLSVINPTPFAKAVKVRFVEGKNGRMVQDFNLFLSPFDVWTAAVLPDIASGGAKVGTLDLSCTLPSFSASPSAPYLLFGNAAFSGTSSDGADSTLDRTREGYFQVMETATYNASSTTGKAITHVGGVPPCGANLNDAQAAADALPIKGGMFGSATLINVGSGTDYTVEATALANFYQVGSSYAAAGERLPSLESAAPPVSIVNGPGGERYESFWVAGGIDPVSAVLMHDSILNEFTLDTGTKSGTDWVLTMPTKHLYVDTGVGNGSPPFQRNFNASAGSCDDVVLNMWDREERTQAGLNFTPPPPTPTSSICWEANVITFNNTNILGSKNVANLQASSFQNGFLTVGFPTGIAGAPATVHQLINKGATTISVPGGAVTPGNTTTYVGLPVVGFALISFSNGTLQVGTPPVPTLSNYGSDFRHKTNTTMQ